VRAASILSEMLCSPGMSAACSLSRRMPPLPQKRHWHGQYLILRRRDCAQRVRPLLTCFHRSCRGQLNFLHTTDTHGWLEGHLKEKNYGADWGDYVSFVKDMRKKAKAYDVDLLLVDTGVSACIS